MKVAIVHEYLVQYGGAERVLEAIKEIYPEAPVYTLMYDPEQMPSKYKSWTIYTPSSLQHKILHKHYKKLFMIYPVFMESFDLKEFDLVISSSYAYAHGVLTFPGACHVCYCHTPMRFGWVNPEGYRNTIPWWQKNLYDFFIKKLKRWDLSASKRPDYYIAASDEVKNRIDQFYKRSAKVIYPPVNVEFFRNDTVPTRENYYLLVSRLVHPYKKIDIAIQAFNEMKKRLVIIGDGSDKEYYQKIAGPTIEFYRKSDDSQLKEFYSRARALVFPSHDDFGIVPLEANATGCPVIAWKRGGILETQIEDKTAVFYPDASAESLIDAVKKFEQMTFNHSEIVDNASRFSKTIFQEALKQFIEKNINTKTIHNECSQGCPHA